MNNTFRQSFFLDDEPSQEGVTPHHSYRRSPLVSPQEETELSDQDFSGALPDFQPGRSSDDQARLAQGSISLISPRPRRRKRRVSLFLRLILILLILLIVGALTVTAYFSGNVGALLIGQHSSVQEQAMTRPAPPPPVTPTQQPQVTATPPLLQLPLPVGWGNRSSLDAENALQVAWTFTQREMRIDYRNVGTLAEIGGTLTAAVFLLDAHASALRFPNDRRSTSAFFAEVEQEQLIQTPVFANPPFFTNPQILQAQMTQSGNFFVWVSVPFLLFTQRGALGQPTFDLDPKSQQPRVHTLQVLLINVPPGVGPMAGIDFEVSDYALDTQGVIPIPAQP